jgi:hypothetical protein
METEISVSCSQEPMYLMHMLGNLELLQSNYATVHNRVLYGLAQ